MKVDFSKIENSGRLTGLFNKTELHGILEASDFDALNNVYTFFDFLVVALCRLSRSVEKTSAMTKYVDIMNSVFRHHENFERNGETT